MPAISLGYLCELDVVQFVYVMPFMYLLSTVCCVYHHSSNIVQSYSIKSKCFVCRCKYKLLHHHQQNIWACLYFFVVIIIMHAVETRQYKAWFVTIAPKSSSMRSAIAKFAAYHHNFSHIFLYTFYMHLHILNVCIKNVDSDFVCVSLSADAVSVCVMCPHFIECRESWEREKTVYVSYAFVCLFLHTCGLPSLIAHFVIGWMLFTVHWRWIKQLNTNTHTH